MYFLIYRSGCYYFTFPCIGQAGENIGRKVQKIKSFRWTLKLADQTEGKDPAAHSSALNGARFDASGGEHAPPKNWNWNK